LHLVGATSFGELSLWPARVFLAFLLGAPLLGNAWYWSWLCFSAAESQQPLHQMPHLLLLFHPFLVPPPRDWPWRVLALMVRLARLILHSFRILFR